MKFHIESTRWGTKEKDLIDHYPMLKEFGYKDEHITILTLMTFGIRKTIGVKGKGWK